MTNLLVTLDTPDYSEWKSAYDAHSEARDQVGLTQMQIWRDVDAPGRVVILFQVADKARAKKWLLERASLGDTIAGQFLNTV